MTIRAELPDGRSLEFPDGTSPDIIQGKVKEMLGVVSQPADGMVASHTAPQTPDMTQPMSVAALDPNAVGEGPLSKRGKSVVEAIKDEAPAVAGSTAFTALGLASGVGTVPTIIMAGLGGGFGESLKQIGQHLSRSLDAPKTAVESSHRIKMAIAQEGVGEAIGHGVVKGVGRLIKPFKSTMKEGVEEAMEYFGDKIQPVLLPAEATESRVLDILHNVSESSLIGGNQIAKFKTKRQKFFDEFADDIIDQFGERTSPDVLGDLFVTALEGKKKVQAEAAGILYNNVSDILNSSTRKVQKKVVDEMGERWVTAEATGIDVPTTSLKDFASKIRVHSTELGGIEAKNAGDDLLSAIIDLPENLSFDAAVELRSRLISRVDEFSVLNRKAPAIGKAKKMINLIDREIERSLKGVSSPPNKLLNIELSEGMNSDDIAYNLSSWGQTPIIISRDGEEVMIKNAISTPDGIKVEFDTESKLSNAELMDDLVNELREYKRRGLPFAGDEETITKVGTTEIKGESALEAWRTANRFYKEGQQKFNNTFLRRMIKMADDTGTGAENIAPAIFRPGQVSKVRKVKRALGESSGDWKKMQSFFAQHLMGKSTDVDGNVVGKRLLNNLSGKPNSFGEPLLREVLSEPQLREIKMFARVLQESQEKQAEGAGRMLIQLTQAGAIGALATGRLTVPAATIIIGPPTISKMMLNPTTARLLTQGISMHPGTPGAAGLLSRITAVAERVHRQTEGEQ